MKYTIKDLREGKCAVKNDGTFKELEKVLKLAFPNIGVIGGGSNYYYCDNTCNKGWDWGESSNGLPFCSVKDFLTESTDYNGKLKGFPKEIVEKMLECQVEQGNKRDVTVFENFPEAGCRRGGFNWWATKEQNLWFDIICNRNFKLFFDKYSKVETAYKGKVVHCETQEQWDFASKKLGRNSVVKYKEFGDCINIDVPGGSNTVDYFTKRDFKVLSFQEWLDENGYVFEDKINVLPKEWCIKVTSENKKMLVKWREKERAWGWLAENEAPKGYIFSKYKGWWEETNRDNTYEITTEQFKKHILHQETEEALRLEEIEFDKNHSWKDYKEGDYVVITEFEGKTDWNHWFMPGEVLKLGGEEWEGNIKESFDACSIKYPDGNGMCHSFEEDYKIRKATQEEIDGSQWGNKMSEPKITDQIMLDKGVEYIPPKPTELKVKLRKKRIKISL